MIGLIFLVVFLTVQVGDINRVTRPEQTNSGGKSRNRRNRKKPVDPAQQAKRSTPSAKVDVHVYPGAR
jgi:hypothetical protein